MRVRVHFWSYLQDVVGSSSAEVEVADGARVSDVLEATWKRWPVLGTMRASTLVAVDVDYAEPGRCLVPGEEVSLCPPVQGG